MPFVTVQTTPFEGQQPGTSGLRKKVSVFQQRHYLQNFVQSIFDALPVEQKRSLVVGGDGRYHNPEAVQIIVKMAVANGYQSIYVCRGGLASTPAVSHLIRSLNADGGIILSASHNPAGPDCDFGIKYNNGSGSPAAQEFTDAVYQCTQAISCYHIADLADLDFASDSEYSFGQAQVEVVDPVQRYGELMAQCFHLPAIAEKFAAGELTICFDAMNAVTGPFARHVLQDLLGAQASSVMRDQPLEDFGGVHPDPCPKYAPELISAMSVEQAPVLGVASDGDGDRNMIVGQRCTVSPSDSLAIIAHYAERIPQFSDGIAGVARSMPTSRAVDKVAEAKGFSCYETPTGWKFFGNLLDEGLINLCGEESFGTGGDHIREKDGLWAMLAWLTILSDTGLSVAEVLESHWRQYGRYLYGRYDYEAIDAEVAEKIMQQLNHRVEKFSADDKQTFQLSGAKNFSYTDPVDGSIASNQGIELFFEDGSRVVYRLSGTGTSGATLRVYLETFDANCVDPYRDVHQAIAPLGVQAAKFADLESLLGSCQPTAIV